MLLHKVNWSKKDTEYIPEGYLKIKVKYFTGYTGWGIGAKKNEEGKWIGMFGTELYEDMICKKIEQSKQFLVKIIKREKTGVIVKFSKPVRFAWSVGLKMDCQFFKLLYNGRMQYPKNIDYVNYKPHMSNMIGNEKTIKTKKDLMKIEKMIKKTDSIDGSFQTYGDIYGNIKEDEYKKSQEKLFNGFPDVTKKKFPNFVKDRLKHFKVPNEEKLIAKDTTPKWEYNVM